MKKLSNDQYAAVVSAINKEPHDRRVFQYAVRLMNSGSGIRPEFARDYPGFPWTLTDFRRDKAWALLHLERHQAACDAAVAAYWKVMTAAAIRAQPKPVRDAADLLAYTPAHASAVSSGSRRFGGVR